MFVLFIICASFSYFLYCNCSPSLCLISLCITFNYKFIFSGLFLWNFHLAWNKSSLFGRHIPSLTAYVYHLISCCLFCPFLCFIWASQVTQLVKNPPANESRRHKRCEFDPWIRKMPWRRKQQPTPAFSPEKFHGQRRLVSYIPWGCKKLNLTEHAYMFMICLSLYTLCFAAFEST